MFKIKNHFFWVLIIFAIAFLVRFYNLSFPFFNSEEARIASRGYSIATSGKDELGRLFPLVFNSLSDYQLPVTSYLTSVGIYFFGRNDFGSRIPFILVSFCIVGLIYRIAGVFSNKEEFRLLAALSAALAPGFIFFSKTPNEYIVFAFSILLIFFLITRKNINVLVLSSAIIFALITSKLTWLVIVPFVIFSLTFFQINILLKIKTKIIIVSLLLTLAAVLVFLQVPQAPRSLLENDFSILQDTNTKVILNRLRGQGLEAGWPNFLEKIIFNKLQIINLSFLNWLSHLEPAVLFGKFDESGKEGFMSMGAFPKIALLPFIIGLISIVRSDDRKLKALLFLPFILTFPLLLVYPKINYGNILTALPFIVLIIALGLMQLNMLLKSVLIVLMIAEIFINVYYVVPDIKSTNLTRPVWIKQIVGESYNLSLNNKIAISDNLVSDIGPYLSWLSSKPIQGTSKDILFPYKFRETQFPNITILETDDNTFYACGLEKPQFIFASKRDYEKLQKWLSVDAEKTVEKVFYDSLNNKGAYLIHLKRCLN